MQRGNKNTWDSSFLTPPEQAANTWASTVLDLCTPASTPRGFRFGVAVGFTTSFTSSFYNLQLTTGSVSEKGGGRKNMSLVLLDETRPKDTFIVSWCLIIIIIMCVSSYSWSRLCTISEEGNSHCSRFCGCEDCFQGAVSRSCAVLPVCFTSPVSTSGQRDKTSLTSDALLLSPLLSPPELAIQTVKLLAVI